MSVFSDIGEWGKVWSWYLSCKGAKFAKRFEGTKDLVVDKLMANRGAYQRPFFHFGMVTLVVLAGLAGPIIAGSYPIGATGASPEETPSAVLNTATAVSVATVESEKQRRDVFEHTVKGGETISGIAKYYGVDVNSIKYLNPKIDVSEIRPGDTVKIPPVAGVVITVKKGDTIYSLAKKYDLASAQPIIDWPYNNFSNDETFELAAGQTLVLPGGVMPEEVIRPIYQTTPAQTLFARGSGAISWPTNGIITQYYSWYHGGVDIASNLGTPIASADSGRVVIAQRGGYNGGYGNYIRVDHGNGLTTLYAHLSAIFVNVGDTVSRGSTIGAMGSTGRSTGPHLHFVVFSGGTAINPLALLK